VIWQREAAECVIQNNLFYKNAVTLGRGAPQGIDFVGAGSGHVIRSNLFFAPGREAIGEADNEYQAKDNIKDKDPLLADTERFDFHLRGGSPAIDAGTAESAVDFDIEGTKRPQGRGYDIGAYERAQ
jgi:hypothetical protein